MLKDRIRVFRTNRGLESKRVLNSEKLKDYPLPIIFYTTHKCASVFMNDLFSVITNNSNYEVIDYARSIWRLGEDVNIESPYESFLEDYYDRLYFKRGEIYTPQRRPLDFPGRTGFKHIFFTGSKGCFNISLPLFRIYAYGPKE